MRNSCVEKENSGSIRMARLATSAVQLCQRLQDMYPQKFQFPNITKSEQTSPFRRWTTGNGSGSSYRHHDHLGIYSKQMSEGAAPLPQNNNGSCGGVARWSLGLEQLLADPAGAAAFAHFLAKEFAAENIRFWWQCEQYRTCEEDERRASLAAEIWQTHLAEGASEPVNVDAAARRAAALRLHQTPPPQDLFLQAQKQIFNVMKFDSYPRFLRSGVHAECARADLRGLPPPYAPRSPHPDAPKLKKSASNASDRRRSGASLLPWKARAASRDRTNSAASTNSTAEENEAVKSSQAANGQCLWSGNAALCRVVLPDGATSVVGVSPDVTVRRLVDRLLQRRNLLCTTYDVIVKDGNQGSGRAVDASAASTAVGGRCLAVERRCVLRVGVAGRAVAVRCRPARRLRHVLRPVLQRYCPQLLSHHAVLLGSTPLHPDTLVQELDGARIQVVEVSNAMGVPSSAVLVTPEPRERDDDTDSLSDVALRIQDENNEDAQSAHRSSVSSASSVSGDGGQSARVRAALRPGHPLHHHPPDFLDNLRETQRQRLQPRTPPPLPPKPPQRSAPTVV